MPPEPTRRVPAAGLLLCASLASLGGCAALRPAAETVRPAPAQATPDLPTLQAAALADSTLALHRFSGAPPEDQRALLAAARQAAEQTPSPASRLRYALLLALPGHSGAEPEAARQILQSLLAQPAQLTLARPQHQLELAQLLLRLQHQREAARRTLMRQPHRCQL